MLLVAVYFICFCVQATNGVKVCNQHNGMFFHSYSDQRFRSTILLTIEKISQITCIHRCIRNVKCKSVSYSIKDKSCCLHFSKINKIEDSVELLDGWIYMELHESQLKNYGPPCQRLKPCNHGNCTDDCSSTGYKCECESCYYGQQCDKHVRDLPWATWSPCNGTCNTGRASRKRQKVTGSFAVDIWTGCEAKNFIEVESCSLSNDSCFDILSFCLDKVHGSHHAHPDPDKFITCSYNVAHVGTCPSGLVWKQELLTCNYA